jgi:hypothetical protein
MNTDLKTGSLNTFILLYFNSLWHFEKYFMATKKDTYNSKLRSTIVVRSENDSLDTY